MEPISSPAEDGSKILVRPARFDEMPKLAYIAITGYAGSTLDEFLYPFRRKYPNDALRARTQVMRLRWLSPRMISVVACPASDPEKVIGYAQFLRLGDDEGAKRQIASRKTLLLWIVYWYYTIKFKIVNHFCPDRSSDPNAHKLFQEWWQIDDKKNWAPFPERRNRWHLRSIVVNQEWRGKGVGTLLMKEVLNKGTEEGAIIGLEASPDGEHLYRKVGFELLSRFYNEPGSPLDSLDGGGVMMWRPDKMKRS